MKRHKGLRRFLITLCVIALALGGVYVGGREVVKLLFPLKYTELVEACAKDCAITPSLLYGVIRTESRFRPEAASTAGAKGLMQLTEDAFREAQKKRDGSVTLPESSIIEPTVNVTYGSYYLKLMFDRFPDPRTALAAYNAGPNRVKGWLKDPAYSEDGKTLTHIPYPETEHYVEWVLQAQTIYQRLYSIE